MIESPNKLYHFTDTVRLPWILQSGVLLPGRNTIAGFPDPDFLWATTNAMGDRSASSATGDSDRAYRAGATRQVRFTLHGEDFQKWPDITRDHPAWTAKQIAFIERVAGQSSPTTWRCRAEPLPASRWLDIDTRSYFSPQWKRLIDSQVTALPNGVLGVMVGGKLYCSHQFEGRFGEKRYSIISSEQAA